MPAQPDIMQVWSGTLETSSGGQINGALGVVHFSVSSCFNETHKVAIAGEFVVRYRI